MKQCGVGLVGLGKLGAALMRHWNRNQIKIGIYHPLEAKVQDFLEQFPNSYGLTVNELRHLEILILALPAPNVIPFISHLYIKENTPPSTTIINMATALDTKEVKAMFPSLNVLGVKYMGHAKDLMEHGNGLFITENTLPKQIEDLFKYLGQIKIDHESCLTEVNKLATYLAIQAAIHIESEFAKKGYSPKYVNRALSSIAPEVIRGYCEGSLGHFASEIVKEIKGEA